MFKSVLYVSEQMWQICGEDKGRSVVTIQAVRVQVHWLGLGVKVKDGVME